MPERADALLGRTLHAQYEIERELGRGGMAVVYAARDLRHSRHVAIKVLHEELSGATNAERFVREIQVAARLSHANIVPLFDSGSEEGMLYYVMPLVDGESLRVRLDRERQLPIDEALAITEQIAAALDYAHANGIVHRDIKPENILLAGDHVLVADFGLARALERGAGARLTQSGLAIGTPMYMSPEQAAADPALDGRADVYSLACTTFEMITGLAPFRGATPQAVVAQHLGSPPPSARMLRNTCPMPVDAALRRGMAKLAADRFRTAGEFARAIRSAPAGHWPALTAGTSSRARWLSFGAIAVAAVLVAAIAGTVMLVRGRASRVDPSLLALLPLTSAAGNVSDGVAREVTDRVSDALREWNGISLVDERRMGERVSGARRQKLPDALAAARDVGAGALLWGDVERERDSLRVHLTMYGTERGEQIRARTVNLASVNIADLDRYRVLVNGVLRERDELPWTGSGDHYRPSLPAWREYDDGRRLLASWNLTAAVESFRRALQRDPDLAQAQLWLAQSLTWLGDRKLAGERKAYAEQAAARISRLTPVDAARAQAIVALAESRHADACAAYRTLRAEHADEFTVWYGLGDCQSRDSTVIPNRRSPSGYAFRGSFAEAARMYERAIQSLGLPYPDFPFVRLGDVLYTTSSRLRFGFLAGHTDKRFAAFASQRADTLAFVPIPASEISAATARSVPATTGEAILRNQRELRDIYTAWVRAMPQNTLAHERLADVLESLGIIAESDPQGNSALSEIRRARALATDTTKSRWLAFAQVRLLLKAGDPAAAKQLVDSMLRRDSSSSVANADALIGPAALTGRLHRASELMRAAENLPRYLVAGANGTALHLQPALLGERATVLAHAALGVCDTVVRGFTAHVDEVLGSYVSDPGERQRDRNALLMRPLIVAVPCLGPAAANDLPSSSERLVAMDKALARGDLAALRAEFDTVRALRRYMRPGEVAIDHVYLEAWLLMAAGDTAAASRWLDQSLTAPSVLSPYLLLDAVNAASFVRAMALGAELAAARHDRERSRQWARTVAILWADADRPLQPLVARMQVLADSTGDVAEKK